MSALDEQEEELLPTLDGLQAAMEDLKKLYGIRGEVSHRLASLSAKLQVRTKCIEALYNYFDLVSEDVEVLKSNMPLDVETVLIIAQGFTEQREQLEKILVKTREALLKPLKPMDKDQMLEESTIHSVYALNAQYRIAKQLAELESARGDSSA